MSLTAPLGLFFLLSVPLVVVFYLLRVRLRDREVSSAYLWEHLMRDLAAQDPWQKPRFTLLMLVQMLLLTVLSFALARPSWLAMAEESVFEVVVLDSSASMQATDVHGSRFSEARNLASEAIRLLPDGSEIALIAAGNRPKVLVPATGNRENVLAQLDAAMPNGGTVDIDGTLRLATALIAGRKNGQVVVFTDGAFDGLESELQNGARYHLVSGGSYNQAITAIAARPDQANNRRAQLFTRVRNFSDEPVAVTLGIYVDETLADSRALQLNSNGAQELIFDRLPDGARFIQARLLQNDDLPADNVATVVLDRPRPTKILLVSTGNIFVERVLLSLGNVDLYHVSPGRYGAINVAKYDLIVFDGFLPDWLPQQNLLVINPPDSTLVKVQGTINRPAVTTWDGADRLLQYIPSLNDLQILRSAKIEAPSWAKSVVSANGMPLIMAGLRGTQRVVIVGFDLQESNLPLLATFPIFTANAIGYLEPSGIVSERTTMAGAAVAIQPLPQAEEVVVQRPDGNQDHFFGGKLLSYDQTTEIGLYSIRQTAHGEVISNEHFAVNLLSDEESNIRPRFQQSGPEPDASSEKTVPVQREIWPWMIITALVILSGEWWWYHRRG